MHNFLSFVAIACLLGQVAGRTAQLVELNEENWKQMLKSEWMIEFHAPWCPACKDLSKTWDSFATWSKDLDIKVGEVDVTANPGLSGRFLVTALPTIYHVKDGVFRLYQGSRDKNDFIQFIEEKKWTIVEPLSSWKNPESVQMSVVAMFFRLSMYVRDLHTYFVETRGLPSWASYGIFGAATLLLGCLLGFVIVCIIDCVFPAAAMPAKNKQQQQQKKGKDEKKGKENEKAKETPKKTKDDDKGTHSQSDTEGSQHSQTDAENSSAAEDEGGLRQRKDNKQTTPTKPAVVANNNKTTTPNSDMKKKK